MKRKVDWLSFFKVVDLLLLAYFYLAVFFNLHSVADISQLFIGGIIYFMVSCLLNPSLFNADIFMRTRWVICILMISTLLLIPILPALFLVVYSFSPDLFIWGMLIFLRYSYLFYVCLSLLETFRYFRKKIVFK